MAVRTPASWVFVLASLIAVALVGPGHAAVPPVVSTCSRSRVKTR